ncbi:unnamed protein product [Triticum turgidum subsp. durum]|uniref:Uncharacterized protein n=1 Tax=Triticum turgidum subsp. durum TaxID=4567 RepID=A0A9R0Y9K8_TRITD|nr:unnamed protein product [Triticum turgidum subsp. durum]
MAPTAAEQHTRKAVGLAARDASGHLTPLAITRRYPCEHLQDIKPTQYLEINKVIKAPHSDGGVFFH